MLIRVYYDNGVCSNCEKEFFIKSENLKNKKKIMEEIEKEFRQTGIKKYYDISYHKV